MDMQELIRKARNADAAAQKYLFEQWSAKMLMLCRRYVKNAEDAEELMLNGFFKFFTHLSSFNYQGDASLQAWLKKIMINECLMFMRKKNLFVIVSEKRQDEISIEDEALNNLSAAEIFNLIIQLPAGYRTVFNLYAVEGMSHKEVAKLLGISEGTSKSQLSKAKAMLQKMYTQNQSNYVTRKSQ
jgi:RNA polymerase sigma factor (sigma-70 family)